jgi:putative ABC transport system permease protein
MDIGPIVRALRRNKVRAGLIVAEIALTLAIVTNCVAMIVDAREKMTRRSGFDDENIVSLRSTPFDPAFKEDGYLDNSLRQDLDALRGLPGVVGVSNTNFLPWQGGGSSTELRPIGGAEGLRTQIYNTDEGTFDALGIKVSEGRGFTRDHVDTDMLRLRKLFAEQRPVGTDGRPTEKFLQEVVVSRAFARLAFGEGPPLGKMLEDTDGDQYRVVGVVEEFYNPYGWPIHEYVVFFANRARSYQGGAGFLLRTEPGQAAAVAKAAEQKLLEVNGGRNIRTRTLEEIKDQYFGPQSIVVTLMGAVIVMLVLVTSLGIVGLTSFSVTERTRQIGTRRALGARRVDILRHFLLENWLLTTLALVLGCGLAIAVNVGVVSAAGGTKLGWLTVAAGVALLWAAGLLATLAPALRASRISPAVATRNV